MTSPQSNSAITPLFTLILLNPLMMQIAQHAIWDRFFFNVQQPLKAVLPKGEITLLVYHRYPVSLRNFMARARSNLNWVKVAVQPTIIREIEPTIIKEITISVHCQPRGKIPDIAQLSIEFETEELGKSKPINLPVPLTKTGEKMVNSCLAIPIGEIEVRVGGLETAAYYISLACTFGLIGFLIYRKHKLKAL